MVRDEGLEVLRAELGTKPRVYYRNLWRYTKCFIGGTLSAEAKGVVDCLANAKVKLMKDREKIAEVESDNYGDFKFNQLDENSGIYRVEIEVPGKPKKVVEAKLGVSVNLGEIKL